MPKEFKEGSKIDLINRCSHAYELARLQVDYLRYVGSNDPKALREVIALAEERFCEIMDILLPDN